MATPTLPTFPVDDQTLNQLDAALTIQEGADRTTLGELLERYSQLAGSDTAALDPQYSEHDVIAALLAEVRRLRAADTGDGDP